MNTSEPWIPAACFLTTITSGKAHSAYSLTIPNAKLSDTDQCVHVPILSALSKLQDSWLQLASACALKVNHKETEHLLDY